MKEDPMYKQLYDMLSGTDMPVSLVQGSFIPNRIGFEKEMQRIESNVGRYPHGYRHYENYHNYKLQFPDATIGDYQKDINSPITFDEFLELKRKSFVYECNYNPVLYYKNGLDQLDIENEQDRMKMPEYIAQTDQFVEESRELFTGRT